MNRTSTPKPSALRELVDSLPVVIFARAIGEAFPQFTALRLLTRTQQPG